MLSREGVVTAQRGSLHVAFGWLIFQMLPYFFPIKVQALCTNGARTALS